VQECASKVVEALFAIVLLVAQMGIGEMKEFELHFVSSKHNVSSLGLYPE
jgi:hypothetical protein